VKIRQVRATPVRVRRSPRFLPKTAHGEVAASEYVIIEVETDEGLTGLGEVTCSPRWSGEEAAGTVALVRGQIDPALRGLDPWNWAAIAARLTAVFGARPFLRAGIEMACLDLTGRDKGLRAVDLLGGAHREAIATKFVLPGRETAVVRDMAKDLRDFSVSVVKIKVGLGAESDIARVAAVREELGPDVRLTVDANEGWQPEEARVALAGLAASGVDAVEQPLPRSAWRASAALRERTAAALVGDESIWTLADVARAAETGAFDLVSIYPGKCGGLRSTLVLAEAAASLGLGVTFGSNLELGIGAAALAHTIAAAAVVSPVVPSDLIGPLYFDSSLITDDSFVGWGSAVLPAGPGLGVELDHDALVAHRMDGASG
jgi:L-alanine-DL-glutamate epimerase-like enolase superfamily enzyme